MIILTIAEDITAVANVLVKLAPYGEEAVKLVTDLFHPQTKDAILAELVSLQAETFKNAGGRTASID